LLVRGLEIVKDLAGMIGAARSPPIIAGLIWKILFTPPVSILNWLSVSLGLGELAWFPSFFILLLFMAIETAPVFAKVMAPKGAYDLKFEEQEDALRVWVTQQKNQRAAALETDTSLNEKVYYDVTADEEIYDYKKKKAKDLLKLQSDTFYKKQSQVLGS
jgi:hypothetical protein